jgi:spore coat protein U-like protein
MTRYLAIVATAALAFPALADQTNVDVRASIAGTCKVVSVTAIDFGNLEQGATAPDRTSPGTLSYWCSKGLTYNVSLGNGNNYDGTTRRMKGQASTNAADYLPYQVMADSLLAGRTGRGPATPETVTMTGTVKGADYNNVSVGAFLDTIVVTVSP